MSTNHRGAVSQCQGRLITYEELKQHAKYSDAWLSINRVVYDITNFIEKHPHGDVFRGNLGAECGGLFSSAHTTTNVEELIKNESFLKKNGIKVIGRLDVSRSSDHLCKGNKQSYLDRIVYVDTDKDEFWLDLKTSVASYLKEHGETTHYTFLEGMLMIIYYLCVHISISYLTWVQGSFLASMLLAVLAICMLANIAHMSTHSGFTNSPLLDFIAMHLFDLTGGSGLHWQITHQTHHNQPHSSIDHQTTGYPWLGLRIHKYMRHRVYHRYQRVYFWLTVGIYHSMTMFVVTTVWMVRFRYYYVRHIYDMVAHFLLKGILLLQVAYCIYLHGLWTGLALFAVYSIIISQCAFLLLFNDHEENHKMLGEIEDFRNFHGRLSWAEVQVRTSGDWYPTNWLLAFIEFQYGYFNYHIEHHLFPTFKPRLLKKISPVVKSVCIKHGIPYISTPFLECQQSLQRHIAKLSQPNQDFHLSKS